MDLPAPTRHEFLTVVVYRNPSDHPNQFVVRAHYLNYRTKQYKMRKKAMMVSDTYPPIEQALKDLGFVKCQSYEEDDPSIMENWI